MNALELYQQGVRRLKQADIPDVEIEASLLVGHLLGLNRAELFLHEEELSEEVLRDFDRYLERRLGREPLAYILGEQEFWSLPFYVNSDVLIPRPETELLVEVVLQVMQGEGSGARPEKVTLLDMGCGSGVIPIVLALELPKAAVVSLDVSPAALRVARRNAERHNVADRVFLFASDWLGALQPVPCFDLVVSNPPYVARETFPSLQPEVSRFEPRLALDGGAQGMEIISSFAGCLASVLKPGGRFFMEIGADQGERVMDLFASISEFDGLAIYEDYAGLPRIFQARRS